MVCGATGPVGPLPVVVHNRDYSSHYDAPYDRSAYERDGELVLVVPLSTNFARWVLSEANSADFTWARCGNGKEWALLYYQTFRDELGEHLKLTFGEKYSVIEAWRAGR